MKRTWTGRGSIAMAVLAAIALAVTVLFAERALSQASDVVVRGDADALLSTVVADVAQSGATTIDTPFVQHELETYADRGLRYVGVFDHDRTVAEAGSAQMPDARLRPGEPLVSGHRVRVVGPMPMHRGPPPSSGPPHARPMLLVIELEPPVIAQLRAHLFGIAVVAAVAGVVLVVFAVALARNEKRLAAIELRAAREQRLVTLGSMSSVMAHELRNPLASLKGHAQLLAEDLTDEKQRKKAERVVTDAQRLEDLTTSLLDFVRDGPIERVEISADALVERALEDLPRDRVDVTTRGDTTMIADAPRLARAVHNLVDNALKASPDDARVELAVEGASDAIEIRVRDHGPGVDDPSQIFEPFVTTRVRGTGLGLPVARRIAEQHDGTLTVENAPSGGATFTLRIPRVRGEKRS